MRERENRLLRVAARQSPVRDDEQWLRENISRRWDWSSVAAVAFEEGLSPLLYHHLRRLDLLGVVPEETRKRFERIYAEALLINLHLLRVLDVLEEALAERKISVIVFKGAALLATVYRDIALRPMEDIDLLVREEHLDDVKGMLKKAGFVQDALYAHSLRKGILQVDLHTDVVSSHRIESRREILNIHGLDLWERAGPIPGRRFLCRLSPPDELIALSCHLLKHRYSRMIWFVDLAEAIGNEDRPWTWPDILAASHRARADRLLLYAFLLASHLTGVEIPDAVMESLGKKRLTGIEKYLLRLRLTGVQLGTTADVLWLFQIRGAAAKKRFAMENVFPGREAMEQIFPSGSDSLAVRVRRAALVFSQVARDFVLAARSALKADLPPL